MENTSPKIIPPRNDRDTQKSGIKIFRQRITKNEYHLEKFYQEFLVFGIIFTPDVIQIPNHGNIKAREFVIRLMILKP